MTAKTIVQELAETVASLATVQGQVVTLTTERDTALALAETAKGETAAAVKALTDATANHTAALDAAGMTIKAEQGARSKVEGELATAKELLANPAFKRGAVEGVAPLKVGGEPSKPSKTRAEWLAEYETIQGATAREAFRVEHKAELGL